VYKFRILVIPIAALYWIVTILIFSKYSMDAYVVAQQYKLDIAINYATDAAVEEMVDATSDLKLDYGDYEYLACDPEVALDMFITVFLENYGMIDSEQNRTWITSKYLPCFVVAGYDGYYVAQPTKINDSGAYDVVFSLKQPYTYHSQIDDSVYSLNMGLQDAIRFSGSIVSQVDAPISESEVRTIINQTVSDTFMNTVYDQLEGSMMSTLYIPSDITNFTRTNPIDSTTVLAYITDIPVRYGTTIDSFGIGGSRVRHENFVGAYIKDGTKYYQYISILDTTEYDIIEVFENAKLAAEAGYEFDTSLLF